MENSGEISDWCKRNNAGEFTIQNPDLIYPNQKVNIPNIDATKNIEVQVQKLVNQERAKQD